MIVALLVVIILILLLGAGVVKGWIANGIGFGCGGLVILAALLWLGSYFGENGFKYIVWAILGVFGVLLLIGLAVGPDKPSTQANANLPPRQPPSPPAVPAPKSHPAPREPSPRDRVWAWFERDITLRFSPEARVRARQLYDANSVIGLERFCREETERLNK